MNGSFQAVYNGTKAFIDSFSFALRNELNKLQVAASHVVPTDMLAEQHRKEAEPGSARK